MVTGEFCVFVARFWVVLIPPNTAAFDRTMYLTGHFITEPEERGRCSGGTDKESGHERSHTLKGRCEKCPKASKQREVRGHWVRLGGPRRPGGGWAGFLRLLLPQVLAPGFVAFCLRKLSTTHCPHPEEKTQVSFSVYFIL